MIWLLRLLPLLLLIAAFILWKRYVKKIAEEEDRQHLPWYKKSWIWLIISAVALSIVMAISSVAIDTYLNASGNYVPAQYKDGKFVPGQYE